MRPPPPFTRPLAVALAVSAGWLLVVAIIAIAAGDLEGIAILAAVGSVMAAGCGVATWRSAKRVESWLSEQLRGTERDLDLAEVEGRVFIGIATLGYDSDANRIANETKLLKGNLVYAYAGVRALGAWTPARFDVELDGEHRQFTGYSVSAANSKAHGGGMLLAPDAELDDGLLDVVMVEDMPKVRYIGLLPKVFKGTHVRNPHIHVQRAREVRIAADRPFVVYADGDPIAELPTTVRAVPRALRVLVPSGR
jgi:diacylglycerol kinase family enzyme